MKHPEKVTTLAVCHTAITSWIGDVENNQRCSFVLAEVVVVNLDHFRMLESVSPLKSWSWKKCKRAVFVDTNTSVPSLRRHLKLHGGEKCWSLTIALHWSLVKPVHFQQLGSCKQAVSLPHYHFSLVLLVDHSLALKRPLQTGKQANRPSSHYADTNPFLIVQPHKTAQTANHLLPPGNPPHLTWPRVNIAYLRPFDPQASFKNDARASHF